jgi:hypothetical protein
VKWQWQQFNSWVVICEETGYRIIKHIDQGVTSYQAWHATAGFIAHELESANQAAAVCKEHRQGVGDGQ